MLGRPKHSKNEVVAPEEEKRAIGTFILNVTEIREFSALSDGFSFLFCGTAGRKSAQNSFMLASMCSCVFGLYTTNKKDTLFDGSDQIQ
jgi:hypothetical protein